MVEVTVVTGDTVTGLVLETRQVVTQMIPTFETTHGTQANLIAITNKVLVAS